MTIIHDIYGEVEGARRCYAGEKGTWEKNGAIYLDSNGWREKVEERWEEVSTTDVGRSGLMIYHDGKRLWETEIRPDAGYRLRCVERYDLPDDLSEVWMVKDVNTWAKQFKRSCLIIERKVEP